VNPEKTMSGLPVRMADTPQDYQRLGIERGRVAPFEDGMRTTGEPGEYEWWYFDAHLDDGAKVVVNFATRPMIGEGTDPNVRIDVTLPDGRSLEQMASFDPAACTAAKDRCDVRIGDNTFAGDLHTYRIKAAIENISVDITLVGQVPPWRPETGHMYYGEGDQRKLFAWLPSVPQGAVTASYTVDGRERHATGIGYHDHNWGNAPMPELMHDWYWARGKVGDYTIVASHITTDEKYGYAPITIFLLAKDGRIVTDDVSKVVFSTAGVSTDTVTGKPVAEVTSYDFRAGDERYLATFTQKKTILQVRFLEIMDPEQRARAEQAGFDAAYLRFIGDLTLRHESAGTAATEQTEEAIWELMYFGHPRPPAA
jgi:hypothetical protein